MSNLKVRMASLAIPTICAMLSACGGSAADTVTAGTNTVGGTVSGMNAGAHIVLSNNGADNLTVNSNGSFTFGTGLILGASYHVAVVTNPTGQVCSVNGPSVGLISTGIVTQISIVCHPSFAVVSTLAGSAGTTGSSDGTGTAARFNGPTDVALDSVGNLYITDTANSIIRKITPAGVVTTLAGTAGVTGSANGVGAAVSFNHPTGIAVDTAGNVYVSDSGNNTIRKISPAGEVSTLAGTVGVSGAANGAGIAASFFFPTGIAADITGNVYVTDSGNNTVRKIDASGVVSTLAGTTGVFGSADGTGTAATFYSPAGIAVDLTGNIYVADGLYTIRKITPAGVVTTLAGTPGVAGESDGTGAAASFNSPGGIAVDSNGTLYVADEGNNVIRMVTSTGVVTILAGISGTSGASDGNGGVVGFNMPSGVAVDAAGTIFVADFGNSTLRKIVQ
jgi:sugar lactone lactonase YvrE